MGLKDYTDEQHNKISEIHPSVAIRDSDDIVKAHGGELRVETKEGEGSTFIIQLAINQYFF